MVPLDYRSPSINSIERRRNLKRAIKSASIVLLVAMTVMAAAYTVCEWYYSKARSVALSMAQKDTDLIFGRLSSKVSLERAARYSEWAWERNQPDVYFYRLQLNPGDADICFDSLGEEWRKNPRHEMRKSEPWPEASEPSVAPDWWRPWDSSDKEYYTLTTGPEVYNDYLWIAYSRSNRRLYIYLLGGVVRPIIPAQQSKRITP